MYNKLVKIIVIIAVLLLVAILFSCCTKQKMTRSYGGTTTINVKKGYKIVEATWKEKINDNILLLPVESGCYGKLRQTRTHIINMFVALMRSERHRLFNEHK